MLHVENLTAAIGDKQILKGLDLDVGAGEVHAVMGPNGSGKSTFAHALAGREGYDIGGTVTLDGADLLEMSPEARAAAGVFMGFQYPVEIPGVNNMYFLRTALNSVRRARGETEIGARDFLAVAKEAMQLVDMKQDFLDRAVNAGFSGGEKKRNEILQMAVMQPRLAILDETDSGLDIDALRIIAGGVNALRGPERSMIVITHYQRLLDYIKPDFVHVLVDGRIVESGDHTLALHLEDHGYADFVNTDLNDVPERPLAGAPVVTMSPTAPAAPRSAADRLVGLDLPTKRDEAWRYAPHRQLAQLVFGPSEGLIDDLGFDLDERVPALDGPRIVIVNGVVDQERSSFVADAIAGAGVSLRALADASPDIAAAHFDRSDDDVTDAYVVYNLAYGTDGAVIEIADGVRVEVPIHVVTVSLPGSDTTMWSSGVAIRIGEGSSATVVETRIGAGDDLGGSSVLTTVELGDDAMFEHIVVQDLPAGQVHLGRVEVTQGDRSTLHTRSFNLGASYGRLAYHVELAGVGALADMSGLFFGAGEQILDQQITVVHDTKDGTSRQSFRGVLDDASVGVFNGGIDVCPGADGTDAEQSNDNLLLSNRAEINTQPRLEILADEVACKHGATVGQLDDTALYYLRTRGINADEARRLLINGFADQVVDDVGVDAVREWITHRLGHDHD
jgi:FeS assembly ATPase SufC/FeS assembly protein SufD